MQLPSWPGALPLGTPGSCLWTDADALRGRRRGRPRQYAQPQPCAGCARCIPRSSCWADASSPTRRAAEGGRALCTPGPGLRPWEPRFDARACQTLGAHASGQIGAGSNDPALGTTEASADAVVLAPASIAGGGLGEPASVPSIGGAGAKRPAERKHAPPNRGRGGEAPR